jgi:hypothetical protein
MGTNNHDPHMDTALLFPLTSTQPYQREQDQPPLAKASLAWSVSVEVTLKLRIGAASGWLHRFVETVE